MQISILQADYQNDQQARDIGYMLGCYAADPMGGGRPLDEIIRQQIASRLSTVPGAFSILCYDHDKAVGLVNCFQGFSTFNCHPLINIHDVYVKDEYRGYGLVQSMLVKVEQIAKQRNCCKLTLEVLEGNTIARQVYKKFGFSAYELDATHGKALFWEKII